MRTKGRGLAFVAAGAALSLALAGAALATLTARGSSAAATRVKVTEREYRITLSPAAVRAGSVTFVVHNAGHVGHRLAVAGPGLRATVKTPLIAPGTTVTRTVKLGAGTFRLWCPVGTHAAHGMKASLKVTGAGSSGTTGGTTTDSGGGGAWG